MKIEIKELLDELIEFQETRKPIEHLKNAFQKLGQTNVYSLSGKILLWHKLVFLDLELPEKNDLSDNEVLQNRFAEFFKEVPSLKTVFSYNNDHIGWVDTVTEEEQEEIRDYIHKNHKVQVRIRRSEKK